MTMSRCAVTCCLLLASLVLGLCVPGSCRAFAPPGEDRGLGALSQMTPPPPPDRTGAAAAALERSAAWVAWSAAHPGWRVQWNLRTGTPHRLYGPGLRLGSPPTADNIESACRTFLATTSALTGIDVESLGLLRALERRGRWYVVFEQRAAGLPVRGARVDLRLGPGGQVALLGSDWHREARIDPRPTLDAEAAAAIASQGLTPQPGAAEPQLVVVPEPGVGADDFRLAWEVRFRTAMPPGDWVAWVDAEHGRLLQRENRVRWAQLTGTITAAVESSTVGDPAADLPLRDTRFDVGMGTIEFGHTGADGVYSVTTLATDTVGVRTRLSGLYARTYNYQLGYATPALTARMLPGTSRDFHWDDSNSRASERDAYYHTLRAHGFVRQLDPSLTGVDYQMPIVVDMDIDDCNAYYDGFGLNFYGESGRCANTARIADVVYHEYGHAITDWLYRPFAPSPAMAEGFSDYVAATITGQPLIGRGFHGPGTWLRTVDNTNRYPEDWTGEEHTDGLILAGALWDLREALGPGLADTLQHYACYGGSETYDDYFLDLLATDDDNGNLYDGTPHFDAIVTAFSAHGIGDYEVHIEHTPLLDSEDLLKPQQVAATILSLFALDAASLEVRYAVDGGPWTPLPLALAAPGSREFAATIPNQPAGSEIAYLLAASDIEGHTALLPAAGEAAPFRFRVGADSTPPVISHLPLGDQPLDVPGWRIEATVTDNLDLGLDSVWVEWRRTPSGPDALLPLVATSPSVWVGALAPAGASLGDSIRYRIVALDAATAPNTASSPASGRFAFRVVRGFTRDFEGTDGGLIAGGDWQWGTPVAGPEPHSGLQLWGTGLGGSYANDRRSFLESSTIDLTGWSQAALVFEHAVDTEPFYDGAVVQITSDDGLHWETIVPNGGYPEPLVGALGEAGWSGGDGSWERAEFDLSRFRNSSVRLRWHFATDAGVVARGWFLDDLQVVESQVLSVPLQLRAESGHDGEVPLRWGAPAGIDPAAPGTPLLGYHVYRALQPDLVDAIRLTDAPLTHPSFVDAEVVNGTSYVYAVTALYAGGESRPSAVAAAQPFLSVYACDASALELWVPNGGGADTTLTFQNLGTGVLFLNAWLGDWYDPDIDRVRIAYTVPNGAPPAARASQGARGRFADAVAALATRARRPLPRWNTATTEDTLPRWQLLHTDAAEGQSPDLARLYAAASGELVLLKLTGWSNWGDPLADFNLVFGFDSDANRSTGDEHGDDLYVLVGPYALAEVGVPAVILTPGQEILGVPPHQLFPNGADSLEVGVPATLLGGSGQRVFLRARALGADLQTLVDGIPSEREISTWLVPQSLALEVPVGPPVPWTLTFPGATPPGHHVGRLFLETNAPATPVVTLPVVYDFATTPVVVSELTATEEDGDVVLRWRTAATEVVRAFRVFRAREGEPAAALEPDLEPVPGGASVHRDPSPPPGSYRYRIGTLDGGGNVTLHGEVAITVGPRVPARSFLDPPAPNPFNPTTTLRFGLASAGAAELLVYDARGRRVRTLVRDLHREAGNAQVTWDGRDDAGRRVASGVYHLELRSAGRRFTQRLTLVK